MAAVGMPSSWEELPPDLLGQVLHRLPSLADRVRFCAVCWPWRTVASAERCQLYGPMEGHGRSRTEAWSDQ
jgi:hypothetical protein